MKELEALRTAKWHYLKIQQIVSDYCSEHESCSQCPWGYFCDMKKFGYAIQFINKAIEKKEAAISGEIPFTE